MNNKMQTDLHVRLKIILNHKYSDEFAILFSVLICLKNGKFATFVF